jgi:hypothetical protein
MVPVGVIEDQIAQSVWNRYRIVLL